MFVSILVFALVNGILSHFNINFDGFLGNLFRFGVKLLCLPLVAGVSYEILKGLVIAMDYVDIIIDAGKCDK